MSVRSAYTQNSYKGYRPGTRQHGNKEVPGLYAPPISKDQPDCSECPYKRMAELYMKDLEGVKVVPLKDESTVRKTTEIDLTAIKQQAGIKPKAEPKGLFAKFGAYVANNQRKNREAGDTSLFEDLGKYANNISKSAGKLGEEEIAGISKKKSATQKPSSKDDDDEDTIDFLMGKKKMKK
jgi:hypothetical protein